jgi:hypothetical protein
MSKTSIALLIMFFIALITLIMLNTIYSSNPVLTSIPKIFPTEAIVSENVLSINPNPLTASAGKPATIQVMIDSKGTKPNLIQIELAYDPSVLSAVTIIPGTFFQNPEVRLNKINERNGRISYAIAPGALQDKQNTSNIVATIAVTPRTTARKRETTLYFLPKTVVRTEHEENTLKVAYGTKINVTSLFAPVATPTAQQLQTLPVQ